jgi:hypothetical protein
MTNKLGTLLLVTLVAASIVRTGKITMAETTFQSPPDSPLPTPTKIPLVPPPTVEPTRDSPPVPPPDEKPAEQYTETEKPTPNTTTPESPDAPTPKAIKVLLPESGGRLLTPCYLPVILK